MSSASPARAIWLLSKLRLLRMVNMFSSVQFQRKGTQPKRVASPSKRRLGMLLMGGLYALMAMSFVMQGHHAVISLECQLAPGDVCTRAASSMGADRGALASAALELHGFAEPVALALGLLLSLVFLAGVCFALANRELAAPDWDMEWLVTFPLRRGALLGARVVERSLTNGFCTLLLTGPVTAIAWHAGYRWTVPLIALAAALALLPLVAVIRTVADTGLRLALPPSRLKNLQAICALLAVPAVYLAISLMQVTPGSVGLWLAAHAPGWLMWLPPGLVVRAMVAASPADAAAAIAMLAAEVLTVAGGGLMVVAWMLRHGVVNTGSRETGRPRSVAGPALPGDRRRLWNAILPSSPVQRRELLLLGRDRTFLVQSVLLPVVIVGSQMLMNGSPKAMAFITGQASVLGMIGFFLSSYMLQLSVMQAINSEGQALWILYTLPQSLERVLRDKMVFWSVLALLYPLGLFAAAIGMSHHVDGRMAAVLGLVLTGIPIFAVIAVSLGVFASDPLSPDARMRIQPGYVYFYMLLVGMYTYAIYANVWSQALVVVVLMAALAYAFWQKARDALPFLLDPSAAPPARVSTVDGMLAALTFFILQAIGQVLLARRLSPGAAATVAFDAAGATVYLLARLFYWRAKTAGVPTVLPEQWRATLGLGLGIGLPLGLLGIGYVVLLKHVAWLTPAAAAKAMQIGPEWLLALAVLGAPLCEEFIFRGLLFGGLRRSMGWLPAAALSAALFAIVHPPASMPVVFLLGLGAAFAYERSRALAAPMLVHALYNAAVVSFQLP